MNSKNKLSLLLGLLVIGSLLLAACGAPADEAPPDLQFTVTWIGFWFNIPGVTLDPTEVTTSFFDTGVDVVMSGIDTTEGIAVAGQRAAAGDAVWAVPYDYLGACENAPEICLGVPYFSWGPAYLETAQSVAAGTWVQSWDWNGANWDALSDPSATNVGWVTGPALGGELPEAGSAGLAEESAGEGLTFGLILVGPQNDHGWSQAHFEGGQYVVENMSGAEMIVFDLLNPADKPEATLAGVVDDMVSQGATLIITTSDEFEEDTSTVAADHPEVTFINVSGDDALTGEAPANLGNIMGRMEDMKAIAGCAAALTTQTGQIGYLGPLINFETRRLVASAYLGARYCYENLRGEDPSASLQTYIGMLASGELSVWTGPINLIDGSEYISAGEVATDDQIWYLPALLEGMGEVTQ